MTASLTASGLVIPDRVRALAERLGADEAALPAYEIGRAHV